MTDNTEINRHHSRPLDVHRWSDHPEAKKLRDSIWNQYFKERFGQSKRGRQPGSSSKKQFKILLLDLYVAWLDDPELAIGVGMTKNAFKENVRYNALFISAKIIEIINHAHAVGLIDKKTGSEHSKKTTRIRASELLASVFEKTELSVFDLTQECPNKEVIILRKKTIVNGKEKSIEVDYLDTDLEALTEMRRQVHSYNALIWRTYIDIPTLEEPLIEQPYWDKEAGKVKIRRVKLTQDNKFVRRVFYRADWNLGGRFHGGWWQRVKSDWRKLIYINGESTVEQDYSGLHVNLLYGLKGIQPPKDPYVLDSILGLAPAKQRSIVKGIVLNAINANSPSSAYAAFRQQQETGSLEKSLTNQQLELLLEAFKLKHPDIQESLCSDKGVELMHIDGRITAKVLEHFTQKNIPVLSVHDSYIIENKHSGELNTVMNKVVTEELNGFNINIKQEGVGIDQIQAFRNMDRGNALDYKYEHVTAFRRTEGFKVRFKRHKEWLSEMGG